MTPSALQTVSLLCGTIRRNVIMGWRAGGQREQKHHLIVSPQSPFLAQRENRFRSTFHTSGGDCDGVDGAAGHVMASRRRRTLGWARAALREVLCTSAGRRAGIGMQAGSGAVISLHFLASNIRLQITPLSTWDKLRLQNPSLFPQGSWELPGN